MFLISLSLAWLTQTALREQSVLEYLTDTWPTREMWDGTLGKLGYQKITDSIIQAKLIQNYIPDFVSDKGAVWKSPDDCLYLMIQSPLSPDHQELWSCAPTPPTPKHWIKLGSGLQSFQKIQKSPYKPLKPLNKLSNPIDPLEIKY